MGLLDNLIAYYKADEASGDLLDAHSNAYHLTDINTVQATTGKLNGARLYTLADNDYHSIADNADFSTGDVDFFLSCWVYLNATGTASILMAKGDLSVPSRYEYAIYYFPSRFYLVISNGVATEAAAASDILGAPSISTWYHLMGAHDSVNNQIQLWVDNTAQTFISYSAGAYDSTYTFRVGHDSSSLYYSSARIDEFGFWKGRVLDSTERALLYGSGTPPAYSTFTSGSGSSAKPRRMLLGVGD